MSTQSAQEPSAPTTLPLSIIVAVVLHSVFVVSRLAFPKEWLLSGSVYLVGTGVSVCGTTLILMGLADLKRRVSERQAGGVSIAMVAYSILLGLAVTAGIVEYFTGTIEVFWKIESYIFFAVYLTAAIGLVTAAGGFAQVPGPALAILVFVTLAMPPEFLGSWMRQGIGSSYRYVYPAFRIGYLAMFAYLAREAARGSTRSLAPEPTRPFELMGQAIRVRVIAMFVLIAFTVFAAGGKSLGTIKLISIAPPVINAAALLVFAIAALRAGRALERTVQAMLVAAAAGGAWCAGVMSMQTMAVYGMLNRSDGGYIQERYTSMAQALGIVLPLVAALAIVVALLAVSSHLRRIGHATVADSITLRVTTFVILSLVAIVIQQYLVPRVKSMSEYLVLGLAASAAGVIALMSAATAFKRASEATSTTALPTATLR